jgi:hypothetical protein
LVTRALLAMMLSAAVVSMLPTPPSASAAAADPAGSDSAVTVSGKEDFANLKVTVSQTQNLVDQIVRVSWTGGVPTSEVGFQANYLQIMQCWGDDPAGPDRTQCQFGGLTALGSTFDVGFALKRQVPAGFDTQETLKQPAADSGGQIYVPFWVVGRDKPTGSGAGDINDFFDSQVTNEIPLARTHGDGTGEEFFEIETVTQAAGLGCGEPVTTNGSATGRSCWLVIVPRGTKEVNGSTVTGTGDSRLESSPLSQSNWNNKIAIPLGFLPVGQPCPLGAPERHLIGHELAVEAVRSWQPALCAGGGTLLSYTQLPDDVARSQVPDGNLVLVDNPIPPDQAPADHPLVYAPVGLSGLAVAFNINYQPPPDAPPDVQQLNGRRFTSMNLTPRLVAKLLTQSYSRSLYVPVDELKHNPIGLLFDPEFLNLNSGYKGLVDGQQPVPDALVQINGADVTSQLWSWVISDPAARAFLAGTPDEFGMVINPKNKNLSLPTSTFPRNDQSCVTKSSDGINPPVTNCNLDLRPYANDMHDAGRSASRGDDLRRQNEFDSTVGQAVSKKSARQLPGRQGLIAVVDAATASRYGLPTAQLLNAAGKFIAPTPESLLAGEAAMKPNAVAGVLAPDPGASDPAAYPLTSLSYAVTAPAMLDAAAGKDYAGFLRYAGGPGQQPGLDPGQLPRGMVPLPDPLKAQTLAAATTIETLTSSLPPPPTTAPDSPESSTTTTGPTRETTATAGTPGPPAARPPAGRPPAATPALVVPQLSPAPAAKTPSVAQQPVAGIRRTPLLPAPWWIGVVLVVTLIVSGLAATSSPVVQLFGVRIARRLRKGVTPTER